MASMKAAYWNDDKVTRDFRCLHESVENWKHVYESCVYYKARARASAEIYTHRKFSLWDEIINANHIKFFLPVAYKRKVIYSRDFWCWYINFKKSIKSIDSVKEKKNGIFLSHYNCHRSLHYNQSLEIYYTASITD